MNEAENPKEEPKEKPMGPLRAALSVLTLVSGVSAGGKRNRQLSEVGGGTLLLVILIWAVCLYAGFSLFVYLIKAQLAP